jgi:hypothetical protein
MKTISLPYSTLTLLLRSATDCLSAREIKKIELDSIKDSIRKAVMISIETNLYDNKNTLSQLCIAAMPPSSIEPCKKLLEEARSLEIKYAQYNERLSDGRLEKAIQTKMHILELYKEVNTKLEALHKEIDQYDFYEMESGFKRALLGLDKRELLEEWNTNIAPYAADIGVAGNLLDLEYFHITKQAQLATAIERNYTAHQLTILTFARGWEAFALLQFSDYQNTQHQQESELAIINREYFSLKEPNVQAILEEQEGIQELVKLELGNRYLVAKMNLQEEQAKLIVIEDAILQEAKEELLRRVDAAEMTPPEEQMGKLDISDLFTEGT